MVQLDSDLPRIIVIRAINSLPDPLFCTADLANLTGIYRQSVGRILEWLVEEGYATYVWSNVPAGRGATKTKFYRMTGVGLAAFGDL